MLGVFVTFTASQPFDRSRLQRIADGSREMFEDLPGLRSKAFTVDEDGRRARNFYLWDDEERARAFFTDELVERIEGAYGERPTIEYADVLVSIDNAAG